MTNNRNRIKYVGVVGAGNMGSGIAQKIASEGLTVIMVDSTPERAQAGKQRIEQLLTEGLERRIFKPEDVDAILARITASADMGDLKSCDVVIEAIFEDLQKKRELFGELANVCRADTVLATNTSSFLVADIAEGIAHPERVVGLHYFYHPAKNRLLEVIGHAGTSADALARAWQFAEQTGKTPIVSHDAPGFIVNRFFVPWLNEAVRLHEAGFDIDTIERITKGAFGIGMGPFQLMNVTGVPITLHATRALADKMGDFYAPAAAIGFQVNTNDPWPMGPNDDTDIDMAAADTIADRLWGVVFHVALSLVSENVGSMEDVDIGARVGLRWPQGPFEMMNHFGLERVQALCTAVESRYSLSAPVLLRTQLKKNEPFTLRQVRLEVREKGDQKGFAIITINRPDALNALSPEVVRQFSEAFDTASKNDAVKAIIIAGAGKAFVAGADVKFFVEQIRRDNVADIVAFARAGQQLFRRIEQSEKPVVCRLDGIALGGGAELMLACHVVVATPKAMLGFPETGIGIYPGLGGTQRLTRRIGKGLARYLIYTGKTLRAKQLLNLGLAWKLVNAEALDEALVEAVSAAVRHAPLPKDPDLDDFAQTARFLGAIEVEALYDGSLTLPGGHDTLDVARKVRKKALNALMAVERLTDLAESGAMDEGLRQETEGLHAMFSHPNALEGMTALLERRRPEFQQQ